MAQPVGTHTGIANANNSSIAPLPSHDKHPMAQVPSGASSQATSGASSQATSGVTFQIAVNRTYRGKPADKDPAWWARYNGAFRPSSLTLDQLASEIRQGWAIAPVCQGRRKKEHFQAAQHIGLDFDTETDACRLDTLAADPFIGRYAAVIHTTASHKSDKPRARVLFVLERAITDADLLARFIAALLARYTLADPKAKDVARLFFGAVDCDLRILGHVLPISVLEALTAEHERQQPPPRPRPHALTVPTDRTKAWAQQWAERRLDKVAATSEGGRNDELYRAAFAIGQLDGAGLLNAEDWRDALIGAGRSAGLGEHECVSTVHSGLTAGRAKPADWVPDFEFSRCRENSETTAPAPDALHYDHLYPVTLRRRLLTAKDKTVDGSDFADWYLIDRIFTECAMPAEVTITEFVALAAERGIQVNRHMVGRVLTAAEGSLARFLPNAVDHSQLGKNRAKHGTWQFLPARERMANITAQLAPLLRAPRDLPASASEIAGVLLVPDDGLEYIDCARAPVLESSAEGRSKHEAYAARLLEYARKDADQVLAGDYYACDPLSPGKWSAPALRKHDAGKMLCDGIEVNKIVAYTGITRPTLLKLADEAGYESIPQTEVVPLDRVTDSMKARGIVICINDDGTATIRRPNVFRKRDQVTAEEAGAALKQRAQQRGLARRRLACPQNTMEAAHRRDDVLHRDADLEAQRALLGILPPAPPRKRRRRPDRLTRWLDWQWDLCPPLSPPPIDTETGEVLKGRARWLAAFETVRNGVVLSAPSTETVAGTASPLASPDMTLPPRLGWVSDACHTTAGKGGDVGTFAAYSEPREREHEGEDRSLAEPSDAARSSEDNTGALLCRRCGRPGAEVRLTGIYCDDCDHQVHLELRRRP
jgi:hypothetical protein